MNILSIWWIEGCGLFFFFLLDEAFPLVRILISA